MTASIEPLTGRHGIDPSGEALSSVMVCKSRRMREVLGLARHVAPHMMPVLLVGATGTGKELLAREIHRWSGRRGRLVDINCGSLPESMVEALLFGHCRGAFTGAMREGTGLIRAAAGGTLFLDELSSLPAGAQVKLLRVLETGLVRPLGSIRDHRVNFRLVAAAQEDIGNRIAGGQFREDLYQRVAGIVLTLPPLRERPEEIMALAEGFAEQREKYLGEGAERVLRNYSWPGNVRELRHAVERSAILSDGSILTPESLSMAIELGAPPGIPDDLIRHTREQKLLLRECQTNNWHGRSTARALGISRSTLFRRLKEAGISLRTRTTVYGGRESQ